MRQVTTREIQKDISKILNELPVEIIKYGKVVGVIRESKPPELRKVVETKPEIKYSLREPLEIKQSKSVEIRKVIETDLVNGRCEKCGRHGLIESVEVPIWDDVRGENRRVEMMLCSRCKGKASMVE